MLLQHRPDLILLDINLPDIDGYEVFELLHQHPETAAIPVAAVSANAMNEDIQNSINAGMIAHITKPIDIEKFIGLIHQRMRLKSSLVEK